VWLFDEAFVKLLGHYYMELDNDVFISAFEIYAMSKLHNVSLLK
jgi:hypothetical protein